MQATKVTWYDAHQMSQKERLTVAKMKARESWVKIVVETVIRSWEMAAQFFAHHVKYAGVIWILFLIAHLYLAGMWVGDDHRTNTIEAHV